MNKAELRKYLEDNARREMAGLRPKFFLGIGSSLKRKASRAEDKIKDVAADVGEFINEDILDQAGEALEEQILDPAGEFLGEEIARPIRKFQSKITPNELQFLGGKLGGIGGGKLGTALAIAMGVTNPLLLAAFAAAGAASGDVAGDYFTTDENEEFEIDKVSAAFSALAGGLAGADAARPEAFQEIGTTGVRGGVADSIPGGMSPGESLARAGNTTLAGSGYVGDAAITAEKYREISDLAAAGQSAIDAGKGTAEAFQAVDNLNQINNAIDMGLEVRDLTMLEGIAGAGRDFVAAAQPFVDPFQGADMNPFSTNYRTGFLNPDFASVTGPTGTGTLTDVLTSGGTPMEILGATGSALVPGSAEAVTQYGVDYYAALKQGEEDYRAFLKEKGLRADQVRDQARSLRRQYYTQSFKNRGYSDEEIAQVLFREGLIDRLEDYDPNDLPQDRKFGEDVTDSTLYAAKGGRVGFSNGSRGFMGRQVASAMAADQLKQNDMEIANYLEGQKVREKMMDKMKRGLGAMEMNMKLGDPGLFGRIRNVLMPRDNEIGFYTNQETSFPDTKRRYQNMIRNMDEDRAAADYEMRDKMSLVEDYMNRLNTMETGMATGGITRARNAMGTRTTPEGDPISPDMPDGMQMDLRGGGFIPLGTKPKADDIPAMVGKNEFVLNDEAVSGIGKMLTGRPDPRAGARALYKLQNEMEAIV